MRFPVTASQKARPFTHCIVLKTVWNCSQKLISPRFSKHVNFLCKFLDLLEHCKCTISFHALVVLACCSVEGWFCEVYSITCSARAFRSMSISLQVSRAVGTLQVHDFIPRFGTAGMLLCRKLVLWSVFNYLLRKRLSPWFYLRLCMDTVTGNCLSA